jgi:membrane associated rhomboid family serine protease
MGEVNDLERQVAELALANGRLKDRIAEQDRLIEAYRVRRSTPGTQADSSLTSAAIAVLAVGVIWGVYFLDLALPMDLKAWGIRPKTVSGLVGLLASPFLHLNYEHLMANSNSLFILLLLALSLNRGVALKAMAIIVVVGGGLVWVFGSSHTIHIGASGLIFGLIGFLLAYGIITRDWQTLLVSVYVTVTYGGALLTGLVPKTGVSWTGHLFGALAGVLAAWLVRPSKTEPAVT